MILTYEEIDREEWSRLVKTSATGTWFQTPEAYCFYESMPEFFRPFVVGIASPQPSPKGKGEIPTPDSSPIKKECFASIWGALRGVCVGYVTKEKNAIKQYFTRRAIIIGGPALADDASSEEVEALLCALKSSLLSGRDGVGLPPIYIETRNFNDYSRWKGAFEKAGFEYQKHLNFHVDCTDKEAMWERMSENRCRQVRKAHATVECLMNEGISELEVREWYEILKELYRTKVKTPLWPVEFFIEAYRQGVGKFLLVKHEGKIIGGSMVVEWKPSLQGGVGGRLGTVYEWFECGMNAQYKDQYPSVCATYSGMRYATENGIARYDMMGAGEPGVPYGVRDFKAEFGGKMVEHGRFLFVEAPLLYKIGRLAIKVLKGI